MENNKVQMQPEEKEKKPASLKSAMDLTTPKTIDEEKLSPLVSALNKTGDWLMEESDLMGRIKEENRRAVEYAMQQGEAPAFQAALGKLMELPADWFVGTNLDMLTLGLGGVAANITKKAFKAAKELKALKALQKAGVR